MKVSYFGIEDMSDALYEVARFFKSDEMMQKARELVREELSKLLPELQKYRAHLEVQNLKFKIVSGTGASEQYYVVTDFSNFYLGGALVTAVTTSTDYITGGTLNVKPAWVNGAPDATSKIITYIAADYETPCWAFRNGGINAESGTSDYDYSISPVTDYGSIVAGANVALFIAMYAINGDQNYRGGLDKWIIGAMKQSGYGEVLFSKSYKGDFLTYAGSNSLMICYPNAITSVKASPFLSGLWKEKVIINRDNECREYYINEKLKLQFSG
jgi:hypothetical protein